MYEALDLRLARHPSESARYLLTRLLAYCLSYEEGIAFSKGGVSSADEPPVSVRDATGLLVAWIDVGLAVGGGGCTRRVEGGEPRRPVHARGARPAPARGRVAPHPQGGSPRGVAARARLPRRRSLAALLDRSTKLEIARNDGRLYVTCRGQVIEGEATRASLV